MVVDTGEYMGYAEWKPQVMQETGGEFIMMKVRMSCAFHLPITRTADLLGMAQHADVHRLLYNLATSAGAQVTFGVSVTAVQSGDPKPSVTLSTGEVLTTDVVVGADGPNSKIRKYVNEDEEPAEPSGFTIFGGIVSTEEMMKDPELAKWAQADEVSGLGSLGEYRAEGRS